MDEPSKTARVAGRESSNDAEPVKPPKGESRRSQRKSSKSKSKRSEVRPQGHHWGDGSAEELAEIISDCSNKCMHIAALLYQNRNRTDKIDTLLSTAASAAKILRKCKALHATQTEQLDGSKALFLQLNRQRVERIHDILPTYDSLLQKLLGDKKTKWRRLLGVNEGDVDARIGELNTMLQKEVAELERLYLQNQLQQFTSSDLLDRAETHLIRDEKAREMWYNGIGRSKVVVPWAAFLHALKSFTAERITDVQVGHLQSIIDHASTNAVTQYAFARFLDAFGPFDTMIKTMMEVVESRFFFGYLSSAEADKLLSQSLPGTFLVRFSASPNSAFAIAYVDSASLVRHVLITPGRKSTLQVSECRQDRKSRVSKKRYASLGSLVESYVSILRNPLSSSIVQEPTFHGDMTGAEAQTALMGLEAGSYLTRFSESVPGCIVISYTSDSGTISHVLVEQYVETSLPNQRRRSEQNLMHFRFVRPSNAVEDPPSFPTLGLLIEHYGFILKHAVARAGMRSLLPSPSGGASQPHVTRSVSVEPLEKTRSDSTHSLSLDDEDMPVQDQDDPFSVHSNVNCGEEAMDEIIHELDDIVAGDDTDDADDPFNVHKPLADMPSGMSKETPTSNQQRCSSRPLNLQDSGPVQELVHLFARSPSFVAFMAMDVSLDEEEDEGRNDAADGDDSGDGALFGDDSPFSSPASHNLPPPDSYVPPSESGADSIAADFEHISRNRSLSSLRSDTEARRTVYAALLLPTTDKRIVERADSLSKQETLKSLVYIVPSSQPPQESMPPGDRDRRESGGDDHGEDEDEDDDDDAFCVKAQ